MKYLSALVLGGVLSILTTACFAQSQTPLPFGKKAYNHNEWTKGKFSEAVVVTNPGKHIFIGGTGAESEEDGHTLHVGDFYGQCKETFRKIKKVLALHGATMNDVVKMTIFASDMRYYMTDWIKCRREEYEGFDLPASALIGGVTFVWPNMLLEIQTEAMVAR
jgi:2-iminobutanoate/2-iminopropanoate deaminase